MGNPEKDMLNHLTGVSMSRGSNTQTRSFNHLTGTTVGIDLLSATHPEQGGLVHSGPQANRAGQ